MSFETTRWSLVLAARSDDSIEARRALAALCNIYWYPRHAYIRRFQERLRQNIFQTVAHPADIDEEIRYLIRALNE